jgi:hypothetical protein
MHIVFDHTKKMDILNALLKKSEPVPAGKIQTVPCRLCGTRVRLNKRFGLKKNFENQVLRNTFRPRKLNRQSQEARWWGWDRINPSQVGYTMCIPDDLCANTYFYCDSLHSEQQLPVRKELTL